MTFLAVSTFNAAGLELYGRRMVWTFEEYWPAEVDLRIYSEGWDAPIERAEVVDLLAASDWLADFKERHRGRRFSGYRHDAVRFSHKIAALLHADETTRADFLVWIDGDVSTHQPITLADLERLAPGPDTWIAWLDRQGTYPECGFYIVNRRHQMHAEAMTELRRMYADDGLFALAEFHDSFVLQCVVDGLGLPWASLSGRGRATGHPMINGPLGAWLDHAKGGRKRTGRSPRRDLVVPRTEPHWR